MDLVLTLDTQNRRLVTGRQNSQPFVFPPLVQGDAVRLVLQGVKPNPTPSSLAPYVDDPITFTLIKAAIGPGPDAVAQAGSFTLGLVGSAEFAGPFNFNADQATVLAALNALASVQAVSAQGVRLDVQTPNAPNFFFIRWVDTTKTALFEFKSNTLEPFCATRSVVYALPNGQVQILKAIVAPLAFTDQFAYPGNDPVAVSSVREGTAAQNCIQSLSIPADTTGSVYLSFAANASTLMPVSALQTKTDASATIAAALNGIYTDGQVRFGVTFQAAGVYFVEFVGPLAKTDYPPLGVTMVNQNASSTPVANLPLDGPAIELALHGLPSITQTFELEITNADGVVTPVQQTVTIKNDMIDGGMALQSNPAWLERIDPTPSPYDPANQTISGTTAYVTLIGNVQGVSSTSFEVTHNLNTLDCLIEVRDTLSGKLVGDALYTATFLDANRVQFDFLDAPAANEVRVMIASVVPRDMALPHHTHPIGDIVGLQDILNTLEAGINPDAPIDATDLPSKIPWYNYDANGNPTSLKFAVVPDPLLPDNIPRLVDGRLLGSELPLGVPYLDSSGNLVVDMPGPPPFTATLLDSTGHLPVGTLPVDPSGWPGLLTAIVNALQGGANVPKGLIPMTINPIKALAYPPLAVLRPGVAGQVPTLPRALPACVLTGNTSGALALPTPALTGTVLQVVNGASAAAVRVRGPQFFGDGALVGCDGGQYFPVFLPNGTDAYPAEMEQELFTLHVSPRMLANNCRFSCGAQVTLALTGPAAASARASYVLRVQFGHANGPLLSNVTWDSAPIAEQIIVADGAVTHAFKVAVTAAANTGALSAVATFYDRDTTVTAPPSSDFVVRASLTQFDLEDLPARQGQVTLSMTGAASVVDLSQISTS